MAKKTEPAKPEPVKPAAEPSRAELMEEFIQLFTHYNMWKEVRLAYEDGHLDIGEADYDRVCEIAAELGIRERSG